MTKRGGCRLTAWLGSWAGGAAEGYAAAGMYEELSRLSDAELRRRGLTRHGLPRHVLERARSAAEIGPEDDSCGTPR
jgi:hypothetical protein